MKLLGIDCSSTTIGFCILTIDGYNISYSKCGYIKPLKEGNIIERIAHTRDQVLSLINQEQPDEIVIEDIIKFMKGKSNAQSIIMLATFNRMTCLLAYDYLHHPPQLISVLSIRHGIKINKIFPAKEDIPELVAKHLNIKFPYEYKKTGTIKPESFDKSDAVAVALYYAFILTGKIIKKKSKIKKAKLKKVKTK